MPFDTERIRQGQGDGGATLTGDIDGLARQRRAFRTIPTVAVEISATASSVHAPR